MTMIHWRAAALAGLMTFAAGAAGAETTLRLGDFQSTTHIVSLEGTTRWMAAVEKATNGEVKFAHFPSQQAAKSAAQLDAVKNGILDVSLIGALYHAETLPLNSVIGLPGFYGTAVQGTAALQTLLAEGPLRDELLAAGVTPVFGFVLPPYQVLARTRLGMPADWKAKDIRTSGSTQAITARALGAVGISIPGPEVYTAMERGRLDGVLFPLASVPGYNLQEVVTHISDNGSFGGYSFVMVVRSDLYDGLPQATRDAMVSLGAEAATHVAAAQDASVKLLTKEWAAKGIDVYDFTDEELAAIRAALAEVTDDWMSRIGGDGAKAVLAKYGELTGR